MIVASVVEDLIKVVSELERVAFYNNLNSWLFGYTACSRSARGHSLQMHG
jgi:hypothetical protein